MFTSPALPPPPHPPHPVATPSWSAPWAFVPSPNPSEAPVVAPAALPASSVECAPPAIAEDFGRDESLLEPGGPSWPLRVARFVLELAEKFDEFTYGHRLTILYVLSGIYCVTALLSAVLGQLGWEKVALSAFFAVLLVYGLARLSMFRAEDGRWTWRTALHGLRGGWSRTWDWLSDYRELPPEEKLDTVASLSVMFGCFAIALRAGIFWAIAPKGSMLFTVWAGVGWLAIAFGLYQLYNLRTLRKRSPALPPPEEAGKAVREVGGSLPTVIDLVRNSDYELQRARSHYGPYIAELLEVLASWHPKPRGEPLEADYQASLHRHIRKKNPTLKVEREKPIRIHVEGTRRRIDLAIDDCVVIEMKRSIRRTAEADRTFQQIRAYAAEWRDKGPVLLVLCETAPGFAQTLDLQGKIQELRANNYNVVAVAAGRRASA
jgi:hypothetical protein